MYVLLTQSIFTKLSESVNYGKIYPPLRKKGKPLDPLQIPGVAESGWTPNASIIHKLTPRQRGPLYMFMKKIVNDMQDNSNAWPFLQPVSGVADYYNVIKNPMGAIY
jgi:histone acetyltransferase